MELYWWALFLGIIVFGISLYLGKKKGLLYDRSQGTIPNERQYSKNNTVLEIFKEEKTND